MRDAFYEDPEVSLDDTGDRRVYTVTDLNREARQLLETSFASVWVEAEISNFKWHTSGHMYLTLKDEKSQISAVFFSRLNQRVKFRLEDGLKVLAGGRISLYEARGQYQFYVERIEPQGVGALELALRQLKEKLNKEGLFDTGAKKSIPLFPQTVGVITSPTGAVIRDILNVVQRRFSGTRVLLYPVRVQGDGAAEEIARAVNEMNRIEDCPDVLIVARGGGSLEDLWAFNDEMVVRAVFQSIIPVISAVGHETDWTLCDFAADLRAPTPSAAAELVVQNREELENRLKQMQERIRSAVDSRIEDFQEQLNALRDSYALRQPGFLIQQAAQKLDEFSRRFQAAMGHVLRDRNQTFHASAGRLHALSPLAILERGYTVTHSPDGKGFRQLSDIQPGSLMVTRFAFGTVHSEVVKVERLKGAANEK